ncbi:MAG: hypothetical protein HY986_08945 [Candidatus Melainabacteria bacterium]|nr:hypothetical protein [Candidatus Melainabacteria bacterium]
MVSLRRILSQERRRNIGASAQMAEFAPAFMIFILVIMLPFINLLSFATGYASLAFLAQNSAVQASNSSTYAQALQEMSNSANQTKSSGIGQFAKLAPVGGFNGCGCDLFITETDLTTKVSTQYGPNTGVTVTPDPTNKIYEFQVRATYDIGPFLNLGSVPFVSSVPLVGAPVRITISSHRAAEHTDALSFLAGTTKIAVLKGAVVSY